MRSTEILMPRAIQREVAGRLEEGKLLLNSGY